MKAHQSSARLTFRNFLKVGMFLLLIGVLGVGMAVVAGLFVLGNFSGTLQTEKAASRARGLIPVRYVDAGVRGLDRRANAGPVSNANTVPAPLAPVADDGGKPVVRVARAVPVLADDVPVRRAQPVMLSVPRTFNARAEVADTAFIPKARAVTEPGSSSERQYRLPAANVAQRDAVSLNW